MNLGGREIRKSWAWQRGVRVEMYREEERRVSTRDLRHSSGPGRIWRRRRFAAMAVIPRQRDPASRSSRIPRQCRRSRHPRRSPPPPSLGSGIQTRKVELAASTEAARVPDVSFFLEEKKIGRGDWNRTLAAQASRGAGAGA